jgi:hypothetical protein
MVLLFVDGEGGNFPVMPDLIRHPENLERTGCAHSLRSLRLPSVARLEFIPMKIGAGMTTSWVTVSPWIDTKLKSWI